MWKARLLFMMNDGKLYIFTAAKNDVNNKIIIDLFSRKKQQEQEQEEKQQNGVSFFSDLNLIFFSCQLPLPLNAENEISDMKLGALPNPVSTCVLCITVRFRRRENQGF